jgi:crotonobetainyl-CoA:carnitine CoA-transferase CaiB-like acyl-CoA transferase
MSGPLCGFHFLEVGRSRPVAYAGRLLVLLGAEVTLVPDEVPAPVAFDDPLDEGKSVLLPADAALPARGLAPTDRLHSVGDLARLPVSGAIATSRVSGAPYPVVVSTDGTPPVADWAGSGLMELTGEAAGPPQPGPAGVMVAARGAVLALTLLRRLAGEGHTGSGPDQSLALDGPALLGERAAISGLFRRGRTSPGGSTQLLEAADGWVALTLARPSDVEMLAAWMRRDWSGDPWRAASDHLARTEVSSAVDRGQLLGIPVTAVRSPERSFDDVHATARRQRWPPVPYLIDGTRPRPGRPRSVRRVEHVRASRVPLAPGAVVDLSALWAGPLGASLLPGRIVKVESTDRPDGARRGRRRFFDLLNGGKESVVLDFASPGGLAILRALVRTASVVVDSARSRGLAGLGFDPARLAEEGLTPGWVRVTGYGSSGPWRDRVAFGDDAAAAGGLAAVTGRLAVVPGMTSVTGPAGGGLPLHCGDAIADPLTGLHAAVAGAALQVGGGGHVTEVAMREVVGHALWTGPEIGSAPGVAAPPSVRVVQSGTQWRVVTSDASFVVRPPRARPVSGAPAPAPGSDRASVLARLGEPGVASLAPTIRVAS